MYEFCESTFEEAGQFIKFPANGHETALDTKKFSYFTQTVLPQVVGVIDGIHVEICVLIQRVEWTISPVNRNTQLIRRNACYSCKPNFEFSDKQTQNSTKFKFNKYTFCSHSYFFFNN